MRCKKTVVLLFILGVLLPSCKKVELRISSPGDDASVPEQSVIEGTVADTKAEIWVVVHPLETGVNTEYWVQPQAEVKADGTWTAQVYIGDPGNEDVGKRFLIIAVANPKQTITDDDVLTTWPAAAAQSNIVSVTRE